MNNESAANKTSIAMQPLVEKIKANIFEILRITDGTLLWNQATIEDS